MTTLILAYWKLHTQHFTSKDKFKSAGKNSMCTDLKPHDLFLMRTGTGEYTCVIYPFCSESFSLGKI